MVGWLGWLVGWLVGLVSRMFSASTGRPRAQLNSPMTMTIPQIMTDPARLAQLERYSARDPIAGSGASFMPADTKLALALGLLFIALMALAQCVRLSVHLGYLLRAAPADPKRGARLRRIAFSINRRERLRRDERLVDARLRAGEESGREGVRGRERAIDTQFVSMF